MSHELKTPLNVVLGYLDLLLSGIPDSLPRTARTQVERARASALHLLDVIECLLSFARLQRGEERVHVQRADLGPVLRDTAAALRPLADHKGLEFRLRVPEEVGPVETDSAKVAQIISRILSNAIKFTDDGRVDMEAGADAAGGVFIRISDTGPGIEDDDREHIFEPFWQRDPGLTRRTGGSGIGLAVARGLTRLLGGTLELESRRGEGSMFTLKLPAAAA